MIDWQKETLKFTRCPVECLPSTLAENPDGEESLSFLEEGERLLSVTFNGHHVWRSFITKKKASMKGEYNAKEEALEKSVPSQYLKDY